jgi:hypothetical protein
MALRFASTRPAISAPIVLSAFLLERSQSAEKLVRIEPGEASAFAGASSCPAVAASLPWALKRARAAAGPIFTKDGPTEPSAFAALRVERGDVVFAGARNLKARLGQGLDHARAVLDLSLSDAVEEPILDGFAGLAAPGVFHEADDVAGALRVLGVGPAVPLVLDIPEGVEGLLVAGRCDVEAAPVGQLHPRRHEVEFHPPLVGVPDPKHVPLVRLQARERQTLEGVHHLDLLPLSRRVLPREGKDP